MVGQEAILASISLGMAETDWLETKGSSLLETQAYGYTVTLSKLLVTRVTWLVSQRVSLPNHVRLNQHTVSYILTQEPSDLAISLTGRSY